jgi:hypothetical protein
MKAKVILTEILIVSVLCGLALGNWTEPVPVTEVNTEYDDQESCLSFDGLTFYFTRVNTDTFYWARIYKAARPEPYGPFTSVEEISTLNYSSGHVSGPCVSPDNLRLYYWQSGPGAVRHLKLSERALITNPWPVGNNISELNSLGNVGGPSLTQDELIIVFAGENIPGDIGEYDIYIADRPDMDSLFGNVRNLAEINTTSNEGGGCVSPGGLTLYFHSDRNGPYQIFRATRASLNETFGHVEHLTIFDTPGGHSGHPCMSSDGTAFYFSGWKSGQPSDIYMSYWTEPLDIDIKPGSCPNPLNVKSRGLLPVAILGSEDFDVESADIASIRLASVAPIRSSFEDVTAPVSNGNDCECSTEGPDGFLDLTLKFETQMIVEALGEVNHGDELVLELTGVLWDETPIEGSDCVIIRGKHKPLSKADFNGDGIVDMADFAAFAENWLQSSIVEY